MADGAVVPQILLARDENRLAGEPALPENGNPYLETYGRFERVSGLLVPRPGPLLRRRRDAAGPQARPLPAAPLDQRPHAADDQPRSRTHVGRSADVLTFHVADTGSGVSAPDVVVRVDGTQEDVSVSAGGDARVRVAGLESGRHRLEITASDLQETKNSENASALALPNTRTVHTAFTVGATG